MADSIEQCVYPGYEKLLFDFSVSNSIYAATAGAVAAFSLALVVIGLEQQRDEEKGYSEARAAGVALFMAAFFALLVATFLYAESAGYTRCALLVHSSQAAALPFAIGSFSSFAALLWFVQGRGGLLEGTARGLVAALAMVGTLGVAVGNDTLFLLHFSDQGSTTVMIATGTLLVGFAYFLVSIYRPGRRWPLRPMWLTVTCAAVTLGSLMWYLVMSGGTLGYAIDDDLTTRFDRAVGVEIAGRVIVWTGMLAVAAHSLPVRRVEASAIDSGLIHRPGTVVPREGENPDGIDPWDLDAVLWLARQAGGGSWVTNDLLGCLRREPARLANQPGLVARAERFATSHGVRLDVEPDGDGEIYRLYRTDAEAPAYPETPTARRRILVEDAQGED